MKVKVLIPMFVCLWTVQFPVRAAGEVRSYDGLLQAIRAVRHETRARIEEAVRQERVREAWEIGKLIDEHVLQHKERAEYGKQVIERLAKDLQFSNTELKYMVEFAREYPISPAPGQLSWAHYRELLAVNDVAIRKQLSQQAEANNWSQKELRRQIKRQRLLRRAGELPRNDDGEDGLGLLQGLRPLAMTTPGPLYTYRVVRAENGPFKGRLALDLGFSIYHEPSKGMKNFREGDIVTLKKKRLVQLKEGGEEDLYTYSIDVVSVIDGDTLHAVVDLGFGNAAMQTLRLKGIDTPEIVSAEGREAKTFLEEQILRTAGGDLLIRSEKSDKYDRYLIDLFAGGVYLNQELLDEGHAVRMED